MSPSKAGSILAGAYFAFASAIISYEYYEMLHRQPGDDRWWGMLSAIVTLPTWFLWTPLWKLASGNTAGLSRDSSMAIMEFSALVNALVLYVVDRFAATLFRK